MRWTDGPQRWQRVLELLQRLEGLILALPRDGGLDEADYLRVTMRAERLHNSLVEEIERAQRQMIDAANGGA